MKPDIDQIERYVNDILGVEVTTTPWQGADRLPYFLKESYAFAQILLLRVPCLLAIDTNPVAESPAAIRKHLDLVRANQDAEVIYVRDQVTAYNRQRLIRQNVPFIVPGNQMYLPMLAIDLREHFRRIRPQFPVITPSSQVVVVHMLLNDEKDDLTLSELARRLGYSMMTMSRVFDELETNDLGFAITRGQGRRLRFTGTRQDVWAKAQPLLRSPVSKRLMIQRVETAAGIHAGLTALAHYSMLAPPPYVTHALTREQWKVFCHGHKVVQVPTADSDSQEIEIWSYPPALFAQRGFVDPLSLYLSMKEEGDERTQASLEEMMRNLGW